MRIDEANMAKPSYRQILIGQRPAAIRGLDEIFDELYEQGRQPGDPDLGSELIEQARQRHNYIPKPAVDDFVRAMVSEYRKYVEQRLCGRTPQPVDYGTWRGYPREHVPWFPTMAADLCDGCSACLEFCSFGVYGTGPDGKATVMEPFKCQVGCSSCTSICPPKAITFPPRTILDAFRPGR
jgi:NAD-dependent dihydropyrimidine dehydrogenase PreA subunit